ncbi:MAG: acetate/propionate family kinase [Alphaproteobacteria bacterium]
MARTILTLNAGSSSIKFALYRLGTEPVECARGQVDGLGAQPRFVATMAGAPAAAQEPEQVAAIDHAGAVQAILGFVLRHFPDDTIDAVGHRIVHGGTRYAAPAVLDKQAIDWLASLNGFAPLHQPHNLAGVAAARAVFPAALQVGCFDTAFHRNHPWVNDTFALPRTYYEKGVRRYGFHGLSYEYVSQTLAGIAPELAAGRIVIAHLGNGASMCALRHGRSVGSTMGFSALDGLPMGTRCGQLDPGVVLYLLQHEGMTAEEISRLLYTESGLKGLSGLSHDMRTLEQAGTPEAAQAIDYFVFRIRRELGAMAAVLGGLDALVFCGGIGEHAWRIRERICADSHWLGIALDPARNEASCQLISAPDARVRVMVIPTDEELTIARGAARLLAMG